jgi:hypothetical protein
MSRSFAEAVKYNDTYSSMFGGDLVSEAMEDHNLSWGIWQDAPSFHDDEDEDYEDEF